jgi:hypothetical protein
MRVTVIFAAVIAVLAFSVSARAAPPVLTTVGQVDGHPTASWTLPPGGETWVVEIANSTAAGSDGHFFLENRVVYDALFNGSTSWTDSGYPLQPGTYYVHVSAQDVGCYYNDGCPIYEWSNVLTLAIPPASSPPTTQPPAGDGADAPPAIRMSNFYLLARGNRPRWRFTFSVCDDGQSIVRLRVFQNQTRTASVKLATIANTCRRFDKTFQAPLNFHGHRLSVRVEVSDQAGSDARIWTWRGI